MKTEIVNWPRVSCRVCKLYPYSVMYLFPFIVYEIRGWSVAAKFRGRSVRLCNLTIVFVHWGRY